MKTTEYTTSTEELLSRLAFAKAIIDQPFVTHNKTRREAVLEVRAIEAELDNR